MFQFVFSGEMHSLDVHINCNNYYTNFNLKIKDYNVIFYIFIAYSFFIHLQLRFVCNNV